MWPGSYLRAKIDQYKLAANIRKGRIWRVSYDGMARDTTRPRLLDETPAQLVSRLRIPMAGGATPRSNCWS